MRRPRLSRPAGGRAPKGRRGSHAHGNNTGRIHGQHKRVGKRGEVTLVHGKPLRPCGPPPLQGGGVLPPDGQTLCLLDFKSVAAYQRGSMKTFFPTNFLLPPFRACGFGNPHLRLRRISNPSQQIGFSRQIGFFRPLVIPNPPQRNSGEA